MQNLNEVLKRGSDLYWQKVGGGGSSQDRCVQRETMGHIQACVMEQISWFHVDFWRNKWWDWKVETSLVPTHLVFRAVLQFVNIFLSVWLFKLSVHESRIMPVVFPDGVLEPGIHKYLLNNWTT